MTKAEIKYSENPVQCLFCGDKVGLNGRRPSEVRKTRFCNRSCGAKHQLRERGAQKRQAAALLKEKDCSSCGGRFLVENFRLKNKRTGRRVEWCNECRSKYQKRWYAGNSTQHKKKVRAFTKARTAEYCRRILEYLLDHPCVDCQERDPMVLEFDHVRGDKESNISRLVHSACSWKRIEREISKCVVRCANCHRRKTFKQFGWKKEFAALAERLGT